MTRQHDLWVDNERQDRALREADRVLKEAVKVIADQKAEIEVLAETIARLSRELAQSEREKVDLMYAGHNMLRVGRALSEAAGTTLETLS